MKNSIYNYQQLDHNQEVKTTKPKRNLVDILKETCDIQDQIDLGLIRNPIIDPHHIVNEIKQQLEHYDDIQDELGICYQGSLTADDEPTQDELDRALDFDDLTTIKEHNTPQTKRNNFRVVESQRNNLGGYTREILANGGERIITDEELQHNPRFEYQHNLSMAREDGDFDKYNKLKEQRTTTQNKKRQSTSIKDEIEQCFIKVGNKLYGDAFEMFNSRFKKLDDEQMNSPSHLLLECLAQEQYPIYDYTYVINRLIKENPAFKYIYEHKQNETEIKIVNTNNKILARIK